MDTWAKDPLLPEHPYILLKKKKVQDLPWMISFLSDEGLYPGAGKKVTIERNILSSSVVFLDFYSDESIQYIDKNWNKVIPYILHYNDVVSKERLDSVSEKIREHYLNGKQLTKKNFRQLIKVRFLNNFVVIVSIIGNDVIHELKIITRKEYMFSLCYRGMAFKRRTRTFS